MDGQIKIDEYKVLIKEDRLDGYIYICPNCKTYVCAGNTCRSCGCALDWERPYEEFKGKHKEQVTKP